MLNTTSMQRAAALAGSLAVAGAQAATLSAGSQTFDYQYAYAGAGFIGGGDGGLLPFAFFDPALGSLTGVRITLDSRHTAMITVSATNLSPQDNLAIQGGYSGDAFIDLLDPNLIYGTLYQEVLSLSAGCDTGAPGSCSASDAFDLPLAIVNDIDFTYFSLFEGTGSYSVSMNVGGQLFAEQVFPGSGPITGSGSGRWSGTLSVEYDYLPAATAIPIPATPALVALGLAGIARWQARREISPAGSRWVQG